VVGKKLLITGSFLICLDFAVGAAEALAADMPVCVAIDAFVGFMRNLQTVFAAGRAFAARM